MTENSVARRAAFNVVISVLLLTAGIVGGALFGVARTSSGNAVAAAITDGQNHIAAFAPLEHFEMDGLTVEDAPAPAAAPVRRVRRVVTQERASRQPARAPSGGGAAQSIQLAPSAELISAPVVCDRLDDAKINWLLDLVDKARRANPDQSAVADRVEAHLRGALGRNMCADQAQSELKSLCADPAVEKFMNLMVKELPFFVKPLVGDPCTKDLVAAAAKWLP